MVALLLLRSSWRFYTQHPLQLLLSIVGITLGVGVVTAVLITNNSAQRAFKLSTDALHGRTTHHISGADGVPNNFYQRLRLLHPGMSVAPVIEDHVSSGNEVYSILGLDLFAERQFQRFNTAQSDDTAAAVMSRDGLLLSDITAVRQSIDIGHNLILQIGSRDINVPILGYFSNEIAAASEGLLIGDIAMVQSLMDRADRIDRIDLIISAQQATTLRSGLPKNLKLTDASSRHQTMLAMTRGFQINLTAMSLLSLLVGAFLIHNTMSFAVLQRRELYAIKRISGMNSQTIFASVLTEALLISFIGSLLGIGLGYLLAHGLIQLTTQTINDLYFVLHMQTVWFSPLMAVGGMLLGIGSSMLAASLSAISAASASPIQARQRSLTETRTRRLLPVLALSGLVVAIAGITTALLPSQSLVLGFTALMMTIVGYAMALPWASLWIARLLKHIASFLSTPATLAAASIERNISRTGLAIAALCVAVSATFGVDVMIGSFRTTVDDWLKDTLGSDVYVSAPSMVKSRKSAALELNTLAQLRSIQSIKSISTGKTLVVSTDYGEFDMLVLSPHDNSPLGLNIISGDVGPSWNRYLNTDSVLISEPLSLKYALGPGDTIQLFTPTVGNSEFTVAGVLRDYGSSHGKLTMARRTYARHWNDDSIESVGIVFKNTMNDNRGVEQIRNALSDLATPVQIRSNTDIHSDSLAIFDRTFEVTRVLRWLTVGVAFIGIFSSLLALHLERAREFAVLRATGATRYQLTLLILWQTIMMGLMAGLLALPLGWVMSQILIHVINVRSFGWHMQSFIPQGSVSATLVLSMSSAVLAGLYPGWRLGRSELAQQLRED